MSEQIEIGRINDGGDNCRVALPDVGKLAEMIRLSGWVAALQVRQEGRYFIVTAGHRRLAACQRLNQIAENEGLEAPWPEIPCEILALSELETDVLNGLENLGRSDLNIYERGRLFQDLKDRHSMTWAEVAERYQIGESTVKDDARLSRGLAGECVDRLKEWIENGLPVKGQPKRTVLSRLQINGLIRFLVDKCGSHEKQLSYLESVQSDEREPDRTAKPRASASAPSEVEYQEGDDASEFLVRLKKLAKSPARDGAILAARFLVGELSKDPTKQIETLGGLVPPKPKPKAKKRPTRAKE